MKSTTLSFICLISATALAYPVTINPSGSVDSSTSVLSKREPYPRRGWIRLPWIANVVRPGADYQTTRPTYPNNPPPEDGCMCALNTEKNQEVTTEAPEDSTKPSPSTEGDSGQPPPKCHCPETPPAETYQNTPQTEEDTDTTTTPKVKREANPWQWIRMPWIHRVVPKDGQNEEDQEYENATPTEYQHDEGQSPTDDQSCSTEPACPEGQTGKLAEDGSCQCTTATTADPKVKREANPGRWRWHLSWIPKTVQEGSHDDQNDEEDTTPTYQNLDPEEPASEDQSCDAEPACPEGQTGKLAEDGSCQCTAAAEEQDETAPTYEDESAPEEPKGYSKSKRSEASVRHSISKR
ncbi:MAG: hypothetical protein M1831_004470 [Alyxoria varia]|nr:MAG: hypothetical protein M1831_004470 [Alyxoria varia]